MMPEQQSFVLYIVVGSGSRLPKTAPGAVFKVRLHGSLATGQKRLLASKSGLGSRLKSEAVCSPKRHKIGSPASETSSGAAPTTCHFSVTSLGFRRKSNDLFESVSQDKMANVSA